MGFIENIKKRAKDNIKTKNKDIKMTDSARSTMSISYNNINDLIDSIQLAEPSFLDAKCNRDELLDNYNYILTKKAEERLNKLYTYIKNGVPVLLEGETGTSKTLSAEIILSLF